MDRVISYVLDGIEGELKAQGITKREFALRLKKEEAWLHNIFAERRELKAEDFLQMLYVLRLSCDRVLPPKMAMEVKGLTLEEYIGRLVGQKLQEIIAANGFTKKGEGDEHKS